MDASTVAVAYLSAPLPPSFPTASSVSAAGDAGRAQPAKPPETDPKGDGWSFGDVLSALNPLQYVPVVGTIYRAITGDTIPEGLRMGGSFVVSALTGGPFGVLLNLATTVAERLTGIDPEAIARDVADGLGIRSASPTPPAAEPVQEAGASRAGAPAPVAPAEAPAAAAAQAAAAPGSVAPSEAAATQAAAAGANWPNAADRYADDRHAADRYAAGLASYARVAIT